MDPQLLFASADWLKALAGRLAGLRDERARVLADLGNTFGDPRLLAACYVEPRIQDHNPADHDEDDSAALAYVRAPAFETINKFLRGRGELKDGRNQLFLLADAGMGKTSLLLMLRLNHLLGFWPKGYDCALLKLGPDTLKSVQAVPDQASTVLLLDALDEDPCAWGRIAPRIQELLQATASFRRVIIACRTQFFPAGGPDPKGRRDHVELAGFVCPMLFLSLFDDEQVARYLCLRYPDRLRDRLLARDHPTRARAARLVGGMRSLRFRPLLLAHLDDLLGHGGLLPKAADTAPRDWSPYQLYAALVDAWLVREERKLRQGRGNPPTREMLHEVCMLLAVVLQARRERHLTPAALDELVARHPAARLLAELDVGGRSLLNRNAEGAFRFSHYSIQEFLVARALVSGALDPAAGRLTLGGGAATLPLFDPGTRLRLTDQLVGFLAGTDFVLDDACLALPEGLVRAPGLAIRPRLPDGTPLPVMVWVPPGEFLMGSPKGDRDASDDEHPQHRVTIADGLWLGRYPVTFDEYDAFCGATGRQPPDDQGWGRGNRPVINVTWNDATAFCDWLSQRTGDTWRLPTEAEWEYACRAGTRTRWCFGDDEAGLADYGWYSENSGGQPHPVGEKRPNAWGLQDCHGNVWEWVQDTWHDSYRGAPADGRARLDGASGAGRVVRGGSWLNFARFCRCAVRDHGHPADRFGSQGFRCARVQSQAR